MFNSNTQIIQFMINLLVDIINHGLSFLLESLRQRFQLVFNKCILIHNIYQLFYF